MSESDDLRPSDLGPAADQPVDGDPSAFLPIGRAADVAPGEMRVFDVGGTSVSVANAAGRLYGFDDTCTHAGCSLAEGDLDGTTVTCACHGSQFDVTSGDVLRGPASRPVRSRTIRIQGDQLLAEV